jgi:hypothetical protein
LNQPEQCSEGALSSVFHF